MSDIDRPQAPAAPDDTTDLTRRRDFLLLLSGAPAAALAVGLAGCTNTPTSPDSAGSSASSGTSGSSTSSTGSSSTGSSSSSSTELVVFDQQREFGLVFEQHELVIFDQQREFLVLQQLGVVHVEQFEFLDRQQFVQQQLFVQLTVEQLVEFVWRGLARFEGQAISRLACSRRESTAPHAPAASTPPRCALKTCAGSEK